MDGIQKSVGRGGINREADIKKVQELLNLGVYGLTLSEDGKIGPSTIAGIDYFQSHFLKIKPDGKISPNGPTIIALQKRAANPQCIVDPIDLPAPGNAATLSTSDFGPVATTLGCEVAAIRAVAEVESRGAGFLTSKRPKILFEAHVFSRLTYHCVDKAYSDISVRVRNTKLYKGGEDEYPRLIKAMAVDRAAALKSASWGMFQIMGFNHTACGFASVEEFVQSMYESEARHLQAFVGFIRTNGLAIHLKNKNWAGFATAYNGPDYAENAYDVKMANAYKKYSGAK